MKWFSIPRLDWGLCAFSEAGFLRVAMNQKLGSYSLDDATNVLASLINHPGYRYWPIEANWSEIASPFEGRVFGHQQITDAWLLGLAIKENGILVTLDKTIRSMAGPKLSKHVLVLE